MNVGFGENTLRLVGGYELTAQVESEAGRGLTVHSTVEDALEATPRLLKHCQSGRLGRICGEEEYSDCRHHPKSLPQLWPCCPSRRQ